MNDELHELRINGMSEESAKAFTRAVTDVTELVTVGHLWEYAEYYSDDRGDYGYVKIITEENPSTHVSPASKIRHHRELVTRDQAVKIIAAKDVSYNKLEAAWLNAEGKITEIEAELAELKNNMVELQSERVVETMAYEKLEAELDQIKEQEAVGHFVKTGNDYYQEIDGDDEVIPLYADHVDQTVEIERLREALYKVHATIEHDRTGKFKSAQNVINAALNPSEPQS